MKQVDISNLGLDAHFACPICGHDIGLRHHSPHFGLDSTGAPFDFFFVGHGKRKGICRQLDESGEDYIIHFVVEIYGRVSHRLWVKKTA